MDLEESCLLMSTSRRRSLALILLYSLYSSSIGTRSSFWTFLQEMEKRTLQRCPNAGVASFTCVMESRAVILQFLH